MSGAGTAAGDLEHAGRHRHGSEGVQLHAVEGEGGVSKLQAGVQEVLVRLVELSLHRHGAELRAREGLV